MLEVSCDYLLTGEHPPSPPETPELTVQIVPRFKRFVETFSFSQYIPIRLLKDAVAAGAPAEVSEADQEGWALIYANREWVPNDPEQYTCCRVRGRSMYPILTDGDIVAIDHSQRDPRRLDGKMVAFRVDGGVTLKWLKFMKKERLVIGIPENREEVDHAVVLKGKEIDEGIIGRVAWWWAKR